MESFSLLSGKIEFESAMEKANITIDDNLCKACELCIVSCPMSCIKLSGMPSGSPGMGGAKTSTFIIYAAKNGKMSEFMRI